MAFDTAETPPLAEVGGKALSLVLMTRHGAPVPPGFVLTREFFRPWLEAVGQSAQWREVLAASRETLPDCIAALLARYGVVEFDEARKEALAAAVARLRKGAERELYAVRSSSPEEDLEGASFAGGYESVLGVRLESLEQAIRVCAASCLSLRVLVYKREHGFEPTRPSIAVVVQRQIAAQKAGVAFSLNPLNNCYDQLVINANYGLGESVVSGRVSPDRFIVEKTPLRIGDRKAGLKQTAVWLRPDGGTEERPVERPGDFCLSDREILEVSGMVTEVEKFFGKPIDVEWAFGADEGLCLLQARPITAYFPLPEKMLTLPGERKRLYLDGTLTKLGMNSPLSILGTDFLDTFGSELLKTVVGVDLYNLEQGFYFSANGHNYINLSNGLRVTGKKKLLDALRTLDVISTEILEGIDEKEYRAKTFPSALKHWGLLRVLTIGPKVAWNTIRALVTPERYHRYFLAQTTPMEEDLRRELDQPTTLKEFVVRCTRRFAAYFFAAGVPTVLAAQVARSRIGKLFRNASPDVRDRVGLLEQAMPNNCTIEMGLRMFALSRFADVRGCPSAEEFAARLRARSGAPDFLVAWDAFIERYGARCPDELDPATPRYYERPEDFYAQLRAMSENTDEQNNPQAIFERGAAQRERAYASLLEEAGKRSRGSARTLAKNYRVLLAFKGYRELPKFHIVLITELFRKRALAAGRSLRAAGQLERTEDVFHLSIDQVDAGLHDHGLDLRTLVEQNVSSRRRLGFIREYPRLVDSRGLILRAPPKPAREGDLVGGPIAPGIARGKVKVLRRPDENPVLPGEILVARTTDPGWTPLFLNAAGIVLEVGGLLQHGAVVAREYCKPCVAGIEDVTSLLKDGQLVEVDGTNGRVRLVGQPKSEE
jgi:pyruvate,water dikinase